MPSYLNSFSGVAPTIPDFHNCNAFYGTDIPSSDCMVAYYQIPSGPDPLTYIVNPTSRQRSRNPFVLPFSSSHGECLISIELNGPNLPNTWSLSPDALRGMAGWVITRCVTGGDTGGFITQGFLGMLEFIIDNPTLGPVATGFTVGMRQYPTSSAFLTLTVSSPNHVDPDTGNTDPAISRAISTWVQSSYERSLSKQETFPDQFKSWILKAIGREFYNKAMTRLQDRSVVWNAIPSIPDEMTYHCDAGLGAPSATNCSKIDYSQLGAPSDTVMIGPGSPKVLTLDECNIAVSATSSIVITWNQIKLALEGLLLSCVYAPWQSSIGGAAYFGPQYLPAFGSMKRDNTDYTGLNALPPGVNLTAYQPGHYTPS